MSEELTEMDVRKRVQTYIQENIFTMFPEAKTSTNVTGSVEISLSNKVKFSLKLSVTKDETFRTNVALEMCPSCGHRPKRNHHGATYQIVCACGASGPKVECNGPASNAWNDMVLGLRGECTTAAAPVEERDFYIPKTLEEAIDLICYHSGEKILLCLDKGKEVGRVNINALSGCVAVPKLLMELAEDMPYQVGGIVSGDLSKLEPNL